MPASAIVYALIAWCGLAITVNLEAVGGLMLYSLLVNPAAAARQVTERFDRALVLAALLAAGSAAGGLGLSLGLDWPAGASIVLVQHFGLVGAAVATACPPPPDADHRHVFASSLIPPGPVTFPLLFQRARVMDRHARTKRRKDQ